MDSIDSTRAARRAQSRLRVRRQRRRLAVAGLAVIVLAVVLAAKGGSSRSGAHHRSAAAHATAVVDGGPLAPLSTGGLAALWAPQNVVGTQPGTAAAYEAASQRPGPGGYILIADRGNNRILVVSPAGQVVFQYPTAEDIRQGRKLVYNDD